MIGDEKLRSKSDWRLAECKLEVQSVYDNPGDKITTMGLPATDHRYEYAIKRGMHVDQSIKPHPIQPRTFNSVRPHRSKKEMRPHKTYLNINLEVISVFDITSRKMNYAIWWTNITLKAMSTSMWHMSLSYTNIYVSLNIPYSKVDEPCYQGYWGLNKLDDILQTAFSNPSAWNLTKFSLKCTIPMIYSNWW